MAIEGERNFFGAKTSGGLLKGPLPHFRTMSSDHQLARFLLQDPSLGFLRDTFPDTVCLPGPEPCDPPPRQRFSFHLFAGAGLGLGRQDGRELWDRFVMHVYNWQRDTRTGHGLFGFWRYPSRAVPHKWYMYSFIWNQSL